MSLGAVVPTGTGLGTIVVILIIWLYPLETDDDIISEKFPEVLLGETLHPEI